MIDFSKHPNFWRHVAVGLPDECWEWKAHKNRGYGYFYFANKNQRAHRVMWQIMFGKIPGGLIVRHKCDNPACVNPSHLVLGTQKDNVHDMFERGRGAAQRRETAKLTVEAVKEIREKYKPYNRQYSLQVFATKYGVSTVTVYQALVGNTWKDA
jgi:hypothetical protein